MKLKRHTTGEEVHDNLPATVQAIADCCNGLPDGECLSTRDLAAMIGRAPGTMKNNVGHPALAKYKLRDDNGGATLWVNAKTKQQCDEEGIE